MGGNHHNITLVIITDQLDIREGPVSSQLAQNPLHIVFKVFVGKMKERTLHLADCKCLLERGTLMIDAVLMIGSIKEK